MGTRLKPDREKLAAFCREHHVRRLALFGSATRGALRPDSDVDVLVEFERGHTPDFFALYDLEQELSAILGGHRVDMLTYASLNARLRDGILASAEVQYAEG